MANSAAKKLHKSNQRRLQNLSAAIVIANLIYFLFRFLLRRRSYTLFHTICWLLFNLIYTAPMIIFYTSSRPRRDAVTNALLDAGHDLSSSGVMEYLHDVVYVTLVTHVVCAFTKYGLVLLVAAALYAIYLVVNMGVKGMNGGMGMENNTVDDEDDLMGMSRKERRKAERKQARKQQR